MTDLAQCPRCLSREIVEVHGHYQCQCGFYVSECCTGEVAQLKSKPNRVDQLDEMIRICDLMIRRHLQRSNGGEYSKNSNETARP